MPQSIEDCRPIDPANSCSATVAARTALLVILFSVVCFCHTERLDAQGDNRPAPDGIALLSALQTGSTSPQLPQGSDIPPSKPPEIMTIVKEMITAEELKELTTVKNRANKVIIRGDTSVRGKKLAQQWVDLYILRMTLKENRRNLKSLRGKLRSGIAKAGKSAKNKLQRETFRKFLLQTIASRCETLFDNSFAVRANAVYILNDLRLSEKNSKGNPAVPFVPAYRSLLKVINDPNQHQAIKGVATMGLKNILMNAKPSGITKQEIAKALVKELNSTKNFSWYDRRLVQVLSRTQMVKWLSVNGIPRPFVMLTLIDVMKDNKKSWEVRAEAAKGLGLIPLEKGNKEMDPKIVASEVVRFCDQMTEEYNRVQSAIDKMRDKKIDAKERFAAAKSIGFIPPELPKPLGKTPTPEETKKFNTQNAKVALYCSTMANEYKYNFLWKNKFFNIYRAFQPVSKDGTKRKDGLMSRYKENVDVAQAYKLIAPVVGHVFKQPTKNIYAPVPKETQEPLSKWLKKSPGKVGGAPATSLPASKPAALSTVRR